MKRFSLFILLLVSCLGIVAAKPKENNTLAPDSIVLPTHKPLPQEEMRVWTISEQTGDLIESSPDTAHINFHHYATDHWLSDANSWVGNYGSPMQSKLFFEQKKKSDFIFLTPYSQYYQCVEDIKFYNTKVPFSSINYFKGNPSYGKEEHLKASFAVNATPNLSIGFNAEYIYGRGMYIAQSTDDLLSNLWVSYKGKHYWAHGIASVNRFKNYENGGIANDSLVTHPHLMPVRIKAENMPTNIGADKKATSRLTNQYAFFSQKFRMGKEFINEEDSTEMFVPIINIFHNIRYEHNKRQYTEKDTTSFYGISPMMFDNKTDDKSGYHSLKNTIGVEFTEDFNKRGKFGLQTYATHEWHIHQGYKNKKWSHQDEHLINIGLIWSKKQGENFNYYALGDAGILGNWGEFKIEGGLSSTIHAKKDIKLSADVLWENSVPDNAMWYYESNYFKWDKSFKYENTLLAEAKFAIPEWNLSLTGKFSNMRNHIYFNKEALPDQCSDNIQVAAVSLRKDFKVWLLHLENSITYQYSSNKDVVQIPELVLYHNLYIKHTIFKVLTFQIGADVTYYTRYKAPSYMPAIGQFYNTDTKIGNYPLLNVYGNLYIKRVRFFVMYYHTNFTFSNNQYFSMPHYPLNPGVLKLGISWNFYD